MQEGHAATAGGAEQKGPTLFPGQLCQLGAALCHQGLVGGDHVLAGQKGLLHPGTGRLDAPQHLHHGTHGGVAGDVGNTGDFICRIVLAGTDQHGAGLQTTGMLQHFINALANGAKA